MLTSEQQDEFARSGILRLPAAIPPKDIEVMCDTVWNALHRRYEIRRNAPETWNAQRIAGIHALPKSVTFAQIGSPQVREALDVFLGRRNWEAPERWGSLLVAFPESRERWTVPHQAWHLDFPASASSSLQGLFIVRIFICLAKLRPGGGGTVFVAGSHRLVEGLPRKENVKRLKSADARKALIRNCPWVKALCSADGAEGRVQQFMERAEVFDDAELRVVEMTGEPGDVLLTHPLLLHAPAKNCASTPRIVLSSSVYRSGVQIAEIYN
jgi:Phytanoyl-CoA dioxygenase (PhyH)